MYFIRKKTEIQLKIYQNLIFLLTGADILDILVSEDEQKMLSRRRRNRKHTPYGIRTEEKKQLFQTVQSAAIIFGGYVSCA